MEYIWPAQIVHKHTHNTANPKSFLVGIRRVLYVLEIQLASFPVHIQIIAGGYCHSKYDENSIAFVPVNLLYFEMLEKVNQYVKQKEWESPQKKEGENGQGVRR